MYLARNGALGFTGDRARASKGGDGFTRVIDRTGGRRWGLAAVPEASGRTRPSFEPTRLTRHQRPGTTGVEGTGGSGGHGRASRRVPARTAPQAPPACRTPGYGGPGCGARGRWQGLAGLRTPSVHQAPPACRTPGVWGPGCRARGRWRGLAGLRTPSVHQAPPVWRTRVIGQNVLVGGLVPGVVVGGGVVEFVEADCVAPVGDGAGGLVGLTGLVPGIFEGCVGGHGRQDPRC